MNKDEIRALIREEIGKAFTLLSETASDSDRSYWYESGDDMKREALQAIRDVANTVATEIVQGEDDPLDGLMEQVTGAQTGPVQLSGRLSVSNPEPVNPFAPMRTAQQWADEIKAVIQQAKADGYDIWIDVEDYFGPGPLIRISPEDSPTWENDPIVWKDEGK